MEYDIELIKQSLVSSLLSGQKTLEIYNVTFENLPAVPRETQKNKEIFAETKADELIKILLSDEE